MLQAEGLLPAPEGATDAARSISLDCRTERPYPMDVLRLAAAAKSAYNEVEAQIAASRRFYNSSVTSLNNSIQIFPGNLIAGLAKATSMPFYEADDASKKNVNVDDII